MREILLEKKNLYISVYRRLEKEVIALADSISFDDTQKNVYSSMIGDIILRCSTDIEAISKDLYYRLKPEKKTGKENKNLHFDYCCLVLLMKEWKIDKRRIYISHPNMHFSDCELVPLLYVDKKLDDDPNNTEICRWKQAYQKIKHNRTENISKATVWNMLNALGALYILNLYYADESFWFETPIGKRREYTDSSDIFTPDLYDATEIDFSDLNNNKSIVVPEESVFVLKYEDKAYENVQKSYYVSHIATNLKSFISQQYKDSPAMIGRDWLNVIKAQQETRDAGLKSKEIVLNKNKGSVYSCPSLQEFYESGEYEKYVNKYLNDPEFLKLINEEYAHLLNNS